MTRAWTVEAERTLGVTTDLVTAGSVLGLSRNVSYQLASRGDFPVRVLHVGARYRVPVAALLKLLEIDPDNSDTWALAAPAVTTARGPLEALRQA